MNKKKLWHLILFFAIFLGMLETATYVLRDKTNAEYIYNFRDEAKDSIDVILLGSSHMYRTIQPMELWNDYGIASYNLGSSEQSLPLSYYLLKEAIDRQHPRYAVLDIYMLTNPQKDYTHERVHQVVDNMEWSVNKVQAIMDIIPSEKWVYYFFNIGLYHSRWTEITEKDFHRIKSVTKGSDFYGGCTEFDQPIWKNNSEAVIPEVPLSYLYRIVELCESSGTGLILTLMPYAIDELNGHMEIFNSFEKLVKEKGWDYINLFKLSDEVKLDWEHDFAEMQHVNTYGSAKVTKFFGELLSQQYAVIDHRGQKEYESWEAIYADYINYRNQFLQNE